MLFCRSVVPLTLVVTGSLAILPSTATAASCNGDRKLDVPMQFRATVLGGGRVHVSAFGGSDKSGWVIPVAVGGWRLYDAAGRQIDYFSRADLGFASNDMLKETNIDGLVPGASYTIAFTSQDYCANQGTFRQSVIMPPALSEYNSPVVSTPDIVQVGFLSANPALHFSAMDDTGIARVSIFINGVLAKEYRYGDGVSFRWWCDEYPVDAVQSTLEGPNFFWKYPTTYSGAATVDVVVEDLLGNQTVSSAQLSL
jgi:hypothetical protein